MNHFAFGFTRLESPEDDIQTKLLDELSKATTKIRIIIYGFTLEPLVDRIIQKHTAGLDVRCILDLTQSKGVTERVQVQKLKDAGVDFIEGTSPVAGAIIHEKAITIDDKQIITGSYNFSASAAKQVNHMDFIYSRELATDFNDIFDQLYIQVKAEGHLI